MKLRYIFSGFSILLLAAPAALAEPSVKVTPIETSPIVEQAQRSSDLLNQSSAEQSGEPALAQITSVSQLSDVQPTDWAFQALQSLVERYGVIAGYPDGTFRGNRAMTRYEFAAGLNAALDRINELIAAGTADLVRKEDLATLQKLQQDFAPELSTLRGRVDALEAQTAELEANQFSTTTVLGGEVIFAIADAFGGDPPGGCVVADVTRGNGRRVPVASNVNCDNPRSPETNTVLTHLTRLGLETSFTGKDRLRTYLVTGNFDNGGFTNPESLNTYMARLSYQAGLENQVILDLLEYRVPAFGDRVVFSVIPYGFRLSNVLTANSPYFDTGRGAISFFGEASPVFKIGGVLDAGVGFDWLLSDQMRLQVAYGTGESGNPIQGLTASDRSVLGVQLLVTPFNNVLTGLTYVNAYTSDGRLGTFTGSANAESSGFWSGGFIPGPSNSNSPFPCCQFQVGDLAAKTNAVGATLQWRLARNLTFGAWGGYTFTNFLDPLPNFPQLGASAGKKPFANTLTYLFSLGLSEPFGREGDLLAFLVGQPPKLVDAGPATEGAPVPFFEIARRGEDAISVTDNNLRLNRRGIRGVGVEDEGTSLHFEVFYRFRVSDNLWITPGFFMVTNPGHIEDNDTIFVGTIRTTFRF